MEDKKYKFSPELQEAFDRVNDRINKKRIVLEEALREAEEEKIIEKERIMNTSGNKGRI